MQVHAIGNGSYAAYISGEELRIRNISLSEADGTGREKLLELFQPELETQPGEQATLEIFPGREGVLLFLRFGNARPVFFAFDSVDALLAAAGDCRDDIPARLSYLDGAYILTLYPREGKSAADAFAEFGRPLPYPDSFEAHVREHGRTLIASGALAALRGAFRV